MDFMNNLELIKNKGMKITKHKLAVLELFGNYKHLDAMQIYALLQQKKIGISIATVYRILTNFENNNIIEKHNFNNEQCIYELVIENDHHDHLICLKCKKVIEFINNEIEKLQQQIAQENNFTIINHNLNIYGICNECQNT